MKLGHTARVAAIGVAAGFQLGLGGGLIIDGGYPRVAGALLLFGVAAIGFAYFKARVAPRVDL